MNCIICDNGLNNQIFKIKELQLGLGDTFDYQLCGECGSMQLLNRPADFSRYYLNKDYYSFKLEIKKLKRNFFSTAQAAYILYGKKKLLGSVASIGYNFSEFYRWMINTHVQFTDAILDVGCGNGSLLTRLYKMGFSNLTGIDPFIDQNHELGTIRIYRKEIFDLHQNFDLIMMHHSLEHMFDPVSVLKKASQLLNQEKRLLVRIPIMGNYGWQKYQEYWCGVDAPRHIFIPSEKGMRMLIEASGFILEKLEYDSSDYVIWSSEQYMRGIPLHAANSRMVSKKKSVFSEKEIKNFKKVIAAENRKNNGDTAAFYLRKKP